MRQDDDEERVSIPLDPEQALRGLTQVDPDAKPVEDDPAPPHGDPLSEAVASRKQQHPEQDERPDH